MQWEFKSLGRSVFSVTIRHKLLLFYILTGSIFRKNFTSFNFCVFLFFVVVTFSKAHNSEHDNTTLRIIKGICSTGLRIRRGAVNEVLQ